MRRVSENSWGWVVPDQSDHLLGNGFSANISLGGTGTYHHRGHERGHVKTKSMRLTACRLLSLGSFRFSL